MRSNLYRLGLAENLFDKTLCEDLETTNEVVSSLRTSIIEIQVVLDKGKGKISPIKNKSKTKVSQIKARDNKKYPNLVKK